MKYLLIIISLLAFTFNCISQDSVQRQVQTDTTGRTVATGSDTARRADSASVAVTPVKPVLDTSYYKLLRNPYVPSPSNRLYLLIEERKPVSKDDMFYVVSALLIFLSFIKLVFPKYFQNIFRLFFQPQFRQKQTREQLLQNNLPSLLFNMFFVFSGAAYVALLLQYFEVYDAGFFVLFLYSSLGLTILYLGKFIFLTFSGWVFNVKEATDTYIFVVYLINKIVGIVLIPFILILAFSRPQIIQTGITVSFLIVGLLFLYRFFISLPPVRREIKVSPLHFLLYICAFEITPLLLIYKVLTVYMHRSL